MEGFLKKPVERQRELKELHQQISNHADSEKLFAALHAFEKWMENLKPEERPGFRSGEAEKRVDEIQKYNWNIAQESFGITGPTQLPDSDVRVFQKWVEQFTRSRYQTIVAMLEDRLDENRTRWLRNARGDNGWRYAFSILAYVDEQAAIGLLDSGDIQALLQGLSPEGVAILSRQTEGNNQKKLVMRWMGAAISSHRSRDMPDKELEEHYANNMRAEERREVDRLLPGQRQRAIQVNRARGFWGRGPRDGRPPRSGKKKPRG